MSNNDDDTEEPDDGDQNVTDIGTPQPKGRRLSFGKVRRDLTEEELSSSGVQKMLLDELDRMDGVEDELKSVAANYYEARTSLAVSEEKLKTHNAFDILSTGSIAIGSLLFGAAFSFNQDVQKFWVLVATSLVLIAIGVIAKVFKA